MISRNMVIEAKMGLHLRPAGLLCQRAQDFSCKVTVCSGNNCVNGKSVISILGACIQSGDEIELICDGKDEKEALDALTDLIEHGLD